MSKSTDDLIGKTIGQYEILDEIGRGGMATVYRARQPSINRTVALKVLPHHFLHDPEFLERFRREVDVIAHLEHPHILPIYDYGEVEGMPFIAMRYLGGGSWQQWLRRGLPSLQDLVRPLAQVCEALDYAHGQGVIHRDLKPGNILLDEHENAYLSDFGIARVLDSNLTGSAIIGTPSYMSPEQANGLPVDGRSDIYSLGVVLFEMMTGREPYDAPTPMAMMLKHIREPMPLVSEFRPGVPGAIEDVIHDATAKDPDERYPTARDLAHAYRDALRDVPGVETDGAGVAKTARSATRVAGPATSTAYPRGTKPLPSVLDDKATLVETGKARKPVSLRLVTAFLTLAIVVIAGIVILRVSPNPPPPVPTLTPFPGARVVQNGQYTISMPEGWFFADESTDERLLNIWRQRDGEASVRLSILDARIEDETDFRAAIDGFAASQDEAALIDEATAPDGSLRRSYRVGGESDGEPGQIDRFYLRRDGRLVVVEMYTAYSTGDTYVPVLQNILDSLRVNPGAEIG